MPTTSSYTTLLGLVLPVTGELTNVWGSTVNTQLTQLVEDSIAKTSTADVSASDWTLTTDGNGAPNEARTALLIATGTPGAVIVGSITGTTLTVTSTSSGAIRAGQTLSGSGVTDGTTVVSGAGSSWTVSASQTVASTTITATITRYINAPKLSKIYVVINQTDNLLYIRGGPTSPTTGAVIRPSSSSVVAWNGSDFVQIAGGGSGGGASGGGLDQVFYNNGQTVTTSYTIPTGQNSGTFGPITINSGVTVTVPTGSVWTVV